MKIRNTAPADSPLLYDLHSDAFSTFQVFGPPWWSDVPTLQSILTARTEWSRGFSRVLTDEAGAAVGHAIWNAHTLLLEEKEFKTALLAPLGIRAEFQGKGYGTALMEDGISLLEKNEFDLLIVLGHPEYYPKFGLQTRCFGQAGLEVPAPTALASASKGILRPLKPGDLPALNRLWQEIRRKDPGVLVPDQGFTAWGSRIKNIAAGVLELEGRMRGYFRADLRPEAEERGAVRSFLADSPEAAEALLERLCDWVPVLKKRLCPTVFLPLGPQAGNRLFPQFTPVSDLWDGGMARALPGRNQSFLENALLEVRQGQRPGLHLEWGPLYDE